MSLIMPDGSRTVSFGPPGSGFPQYEDFMGQAAASGNKAAQKLASLPSQQQQAKPQQQQAQPQQSQSKGLDMSAYKPGQAQPIQPQSTGTPYGRYAPGTTAGDIAKQPYTDFMQPNPSYAGSARPPATPRFDSVLAADAPWWAGELGNLPHNPADNRPAYGPTGTATGANAGNFQPSQQSRGYTEPTAQNGWQGGQIIDDRGMFPQYPPQTQYSPGFLDGYQPPAANRPMPGQNGIPSDAIFRQPANTQTYTTPSFTYSPGGTPQYGGQGNVANDPYGKPPPFVSTMTDMFGNPTTADQFYPQQDAFIAQLLERMGQIQGGTWLGNGPPPADFGRRPDMNFGEMWNQGGQMVNDGWRNPFSAQPIQPPSTGTPYGDITPEGRTRGIDDNGGMPFMRPSAPQPIQPPSQGQWTGSPSMNWGEAPPRPGTAQPIQPPSRGTPYQPGFGGGLPPLPDFGSPQFVTYYDPETGMASHQPPLRFDYGGLPLDERRWVSLKNRLTEQAIPEVDNFDTYDEYQRARRGPLLHSPNDTLIAAPPGPYKPGTYQPPPLGRGLMAPTPEMEAAEETRRQWIAAGSPGYTPERQRLTWEQLNNLPAAMARDASGSIGAGLVFTPEYQEWQATANRNAQAERQAISQWSGGGVARPGTAQRYRPPWWDIPPGQDWAWA